MNNDLLLLPLPPSLSAFEENYSGQETVCKSCMNTVAVTQSSCPSPTPLIQPGHKPLVFLEENEGQFYHNIFCEALMIMFLTCPTYLVDFSCMDITSDKTQ